MRFIFILKEYLIMAVKSLKYIYQFDKKGTLGRLAIFLAFPILANALAIANAHLTDSLQENFGTGLIGIVIPVFIVVVGIELIDEFVTYIRRIISAIWRARMHMFLEVERN